MLGSSCQECSLWQALRRSGLPLIFMLIVLLFKPQASSPKLRKLQAASVKPQAASFKLQAASNKLTDHGPFIKFQAPRSLALGKYKRVVRMAHMPCHLVWTKSQLVTLRDFKFNCKESIIFVVTQSIWHTWNA